MERHNCSNFLFLLRTLAKNASLRTRFIPNLVRPTSFQISLLNETTPRLHCQAVNPFKQTNKNFCLSFCTCLINEGDSLKKKKSLAYPISQPRLHSMRKSFLREEQTMERGVVYNGRKAVEVQRAINQNALELINNRDKTCN